MDPTHRFMKRRITMNRILKLAWLILAISILATSLIIPAAAYKYEVRDNGGGSIRGYQNGSATSYTSNVSYAGAWSHTITVDGGKGKIKYGYDTHYLNEDYCSTYHSSKGHQAAISHGSGQDEKTYSASAGAWTKTVFVKHAAKPVWKLLY